MPETPTTDEQRSGNKLEAISGEIDTAKEAPAESPSDRKMKAVLRALEMRHDEDLKVYDERYAAYLAKKEERSTAQAILMRQKIAKSGEAGLSSADQAELAGYAKSDEEANAEDLNFAEAYKKVVDEKYEKEKKEIEARFRKQSN